MLITNENFVCGIPKSDMIGKNANEIDKNITLFWKKYDDNGNLVGRYCDTTFAFFYVDGS